MLSELLDELVVPRVDTNRKRIPASLGAGQAVGSVQRPASMARLDFHRNPFAKICHTMECYEYRERPSPNHKGWRTSGGSHGDDMAFDGASLTGPQPYTGEETRVPPVCCRFPLSAGWNLERHARRKSDGRIPRPSGRGGGQFSALLELGYGFPTRLQTSSNRVAAGIDSSGSASSQS